MTCYNKLTSPLLRGTVVFLLQPHTRRCSGEPTAPKRKGRGCRRTTSTNPPGKDKPSARLRADAGFTPHPVLRRSLSGQSGLSERRSHRRRRGLGRRHRHADALATPKVAQREEALQHVGGVRAPFPAETRCAYRQAQAAAAARRTDPTAPFHPRSAALTRESKALVLTKHPRYDPNDPAPTAGLGAACDDVCRDTGGAAPSGNRALAQQPVPAHAKQEAAQEPTPQQRQPKPQHVPENLPGPSLEMRASTSFSQGVASLVSCLQHHSFVAAVPAPSPSYADCSSGFSMLCNPLPVRISLQFNLLLTGCN